MNIMEETLKISIANPLAPVSAAEDSEVAWIRASQQGDRRAFNCLVLRWEKSIYNLTLRMLQNPDEAAEAGQEIFLSAFKNIRRFRVDARFSTWLYRIATNHCLTRLKRRSRQIHYSLDEEVPRTAHRFQIAQSQEKDLLQSERRRQILEALQVLPPPQRAVVELKVFQELTFDEVAHLLDASLSTVKTRFYTALSALKETLGHLPLEG